MRVAGAEAVARLGEQAAADVAEGDGHVAVAEVDAGDQAGRRGPGPPSCPVGRCRARSRPARAAASSRTMLDTVAGARPVCRAMSAWVTGWPSACARPQVDDALQVGRAQRRGRPGAGGRTWGNCGPGNACRQDCGYKVWKYPHSVTNFVFIS